jgi:ATP-binding cassette subfamily G (WHITE) protein 2
MLLNFAYRQKRIDEVLELMGITHCKSVIIGDSRKKGISGGERKRVCVAIELLNRPKLIFLDEPTSGLDSSTALSVVQALKNLSDQGECTVVCTIHQPQSKIFNLFDNLILMKKGCIIYQGARRKVEAFFEHLGFPVPREEDISVADHILSVIAPANIGTEAFEEHGKKEVPVDLALGQDKPFLASKEGARSWIDQVTILFRRNFQQYYRRKELIFMNFVVTILLAVFISCGIWRDIGTGQDSIPKRVPSLFFTCVTQGVAGSLQSINSFPSERAIMLRERQAGAYQVSSYFVAKIECG